MITDELRKILANHVKLLLAGGTGAGGGSVTAGTAKIGLGGNSTSPAATSLDVESSAGAINFSGASAQAEKSDENTVQIFVEALGSDITGEVIREMGVFDASGNMLGRVNFTGVGPFSSTERLQIFLTLEVE